MIYTNIHNLPEAFVRSVTKHKHKGGWISASGMTKTIRQFWLFKRHEHEIVKDVSDLVWAAFGTAFHLLMERNERGGQSEKYIVADTQGIILSGTCDVYDNGVITDYKTGSVWKIVFGDYSDWEVQDNTYAYLFRKNDIEVNELKNVVFLRDWMKSKVDGKKYPPVQIVTVPIKLWSFKEQDEKINKKIEILLKYENIPDNCLPECPEDKLWKGKDGKYRACGYCDGRQFCCQYECLKKENLIKE